jgi:iron-sulfur cluster repair protein YtfE (RIC family)
MHLIVKRSKRRYYKGVIDQNKLADLQIEHHNVIQQLQTIRSLTKEHAFKTYKTHSSQMTYIQLRHFDTILTNRIHTENYLLYPQLSA